MLASKAGRTGSLLGWVQIEYGGHENWFLHPGGNRQGLVWLWFASCLDRPVTNTYEDRGKEGTKSQISTPKHAKLYLAAKSTVHAELYWTN